MSNPQPNPDVDRFQRWAPTYERSFAQRWYFDPVHGRMLDLVTEARPKELPGRILDVGCGTGRLLRQAAERWPEAVMEGVDPAEGMVTQARRLKPDAVFHLGQAETLPFPGESFDGVFSSLSLHHWAEAGRGIGEIARVLRPGGWFCLADHSLQFARWFGEKVKSPGEIQALLEAAGLRILLRRGMGIRCVGITLAEKSGNQALHP